MGLIMQKGKMLKVEILYVTFIQSMQLLFKQILINQLNIVFIMMICVHDV